MWKSSKSERKNQIKKHIQEKQEGRVIMDKQTKNNPYNQLEMKLIEKERNSKLNKSLRLKTKHKF